jgi:hypothetical protein
MKTRRFLVLCLLAIAVTASTSCKKAVEQQYEDIVKKLMVDGSWVVTKFTEGGTDITPSFNAWVCKFYDNNTMTATQGATVQGGIWQSNLSSQSFTAQFSNSVGDPLQKINGTWSIVSTSATKGGFAQTRNGVAYTMELTKY